MSKKSKVSKTVTSKRTKSGTSKTKSQNSKVPSKSKCVGKSSKSRKAGPSLPALTSPTLKKIQTYYLRQKNISSGKSSSRCKKSASNLSKPAKSEKFDLMEIETTVDKLPTGNNKSNFPNLPELFAVTGNGKAAKSKSGGKSKSAPKSAIKPKSNKSQVKSATKARKSNCTGKTKSKAMKSSTKSKSK